MKKFWHKSIVDSKNQCLQVFPSNRENVNGNLDYSYQKYKVWNLCV